MVFQVLFFLVNTIRFRAEQFYRRADLRRAVMYNPFNWRYNFMIGNVYLRLGQYETAKAYYRVVLALAPNYFDAASNMALVLAREGQVEKARVIYEKILEMWPRHQEARRDLAVIQNYMERRNNHGN